MTGYASVTDPTTGGNGEGNINGTTNHVTRLYNTLMGYLASTTENISGVYDMAGGALEHVMGNNDRLVGNSGITSWYNDFFSNNIRWMKYYERYSSTSEKNYADRILGDATGEMGPFSNNSIYQGSWYNDRAYFVNSESVWFARGGDYMGGVHAGIFNFVCSMGDKYSNYTFRVVLSTFKKN